MTPDNRDGPVSIQAAADKNEQAIDEEDSDVDDDFAQLQRIQSAKRREDKQQKPRIQELLDPFPFAPNIRPLGTSDLRSAIALENAAFTDPQHRASSEKIEYRLTTCPELSLGVFQTVVPGQIKDVDMFPALDFAHSVETKRPDGAKSVLIAHIIATASNSTVVTDKTMDIPANWKGVKGNGELGHLEGGRVICMHSLAVAPKMQGCGLGKLVIKSFLQQMKTIGSERVALICQDYLVTYYERFGFKHVGKSNAKFGGGGWHNMIFDLGGGAAPCTSSSSS
ncbi:hypothetical protein N0V93_007510 [Gnomoniopsis smithogilvyi]|uniref:N-acetyltransferase domain-containing protein n=1 Tax=Gnomoniopsis smithogilvyi TaxID=1191159 RepID=A0A9W9CWQ9_9PEZI|nr:hypothetical protein N0V93_007510 [Gnomoniopsis smithogilvyi]